MDIQTPIIEYVARVLDSGKPHYAASSTNSPINLSLIAKIPIDPSVNQCQGFCYNSKKDVFVLACINSDNTKQIIYELAPTTFKIVGTYKFSDPVNLAHMNTLTYNPANNTLYTTNAVVSGYRVTPIDADTMTVKPPIPVKEKIFNLAYDIKTGRFISIVPINHTMRRINFYNDAFSLISSREIDAKHTDLNNNGAYMYDGEGLFTTRTTFVGLDKNGAVKHIAPYPSGMEVEDMDTRKGIMYVAANRKGGVEIYAIPTVPFKV